MSNIIKSDFVSILDQKKSIENIDVNHKRIINKPKNEEADVVNSDEETGNEDFAELLSKEASEVKTEKQEPKQSAEEIIAEAKQQAAQIIEDARADAALAVSEMKQAGYEEGYKEGEKKAEALIATEQEQFQKEREAFEEEYKSLVRSIEPRMVQLVIDLVEKLVGQITVSEDTIEFIIKKGFEEIELTGHICIKVSEADYEYVVAHQNQIFANISTKTTTEILLDYNLASNDCIIETDLGNIDCSLDKQLKRLTAELALIKESLMKE